MNRGRLSPSTVLAGNDVSVADAGDPAPALRTVGLTKSFAGNTVLRAVDFEVRPGEIHALVGENGAGKSTLINLITGVHQPDAGTISLAGTVVDRFGPRQAESLGVATVHQELSLCPHLTVAENVFLARPPTRFGRIDAGQMERRTASRFRDLGVEIDPTALAGELPLAEQQLVEFAKATVRPLRVLILDEATSALDSGQVGLLFAALRRLRDDGAAIIFVSHRLDEVFAISDRITVLRNGEYVATVPGASTTTDQLVQLMVGRGVEDIFPPKPPTADVLAQPVVLSVQDLASGKRFENVSFDLHRGEILGLGGLQGQGQHELLEALFGLHRVEGGLGLGGHPERIRNPRDAMRHGLAYVPEDRKTEGLLVPLSVRENLALPNLGRLSRWGILRRRGETDLVGDLVRRLQVRLRSPRQSLLRLSGGNQQKVAIAKWLPLQPSVFLLAEPTRGIDVGTKQEIYRLMRELTAAGASVLLISSDTIELLGLCDRVLAMYERRPVAMLAGDEVTEQNVVHAAVAGTAAGASTAPALAPSVERGRGESVPGTGAPRPSRPSAHRRLPRVWQDLGAIYGVMLLFVLVYLYGNRNTLSLDTINNLSAYLFPLFLTALAQSVVMLTGGIDLSIGAMVSLATVLLATQMYDSPSSMVKAVVLVMAVGALLGLATGSVVTFARLPAIIVTLATSFLWAGLALFVLEVPGGHLPRGFARGMTGQVGGIVPVTLLVLAAVLLVWKAIKTTPLGLSIYAVGDNPAGAYASGVHVRRSRLAAYTIAGVLTAIGGIGLAAYSGTGDPLIGTPYTLASISAAVLGGISFFGGQGHLRGTIAGTLILGLLIQILFISGLSPSYQRVIQGVVLIVALGIKAAASYRLAKGR